MESYNIKDWLELFSYAATIIGIPLAIYVYYNDKLKDRKLKEKEALFTGHSLYADYLKLCLENPELQVYSTTLNKKDISPDEKKELIIFEILFTYLESTYLYYKDQSADVKNNRWEGWVNYIREFSEDDTFRKAWEMTGGQWDKEFMKLMNEIIRRN
ncbi:MAG: hypothetical protein IPM96_09390 [Ignavibacteria bacterium]|nr:hypothetical protein [Ignavibacteria bacterium]